jgi:hypothetical protein
LLWPTIFCFAQKSFGKRAPEKTHFCLLNYFACFFRIYQTTMASVTNVPNAGFSPEVYNAYKQQQLTDEQIVARRARVEYLLNRYQGMSTDAMKTWETNFIQEFGISPSVIAQEKEKADAAIESSRSDNPYKEEITQAEAQFSATQSLVDNEFNQVVKEKYGVDLANRDFLIALGAVDPIDVVMDNYQGDVNRLFNAGQAKEAAAFVQSKVNEISKDLAARQASLASGPLAQQITGAQAKIKALTGIDVKATKDFSALRSKLHEEKLAVEAKHGLREKATQVNLLRRKFVGLQEHRIGFPWFFKNWLKRTITVGK